MKKIFFTAAAVVFTTLFLSASARIVANPDKESHRQLHKERKEMRKEERLHSVDVATEKQFENDFPNALNVSWYQGSFAEASFDDGDIHKTAYYDTDHHLVGTTTVADYMMLPEKARELIAQKNKGYTIEKVILFKDNKANETDMSLFSLSFPDEDNYFPLLSKGSKNIILKVSMNGSVSGFQSYKHK